MWASDHSSDRGASPNMDTSREDDRARKASVTCALTVPCVREARSAYAPKRSRAWPLIPAASPLHVARRSWGFVVGASQEVIHPGF
ncbi:hypothetical protein OPT61_g651 [Boeremia exigua]|uniref:Uncharacterized protein n=1 Tax=Boeremia exigua TaxID=749465 RepID=A0ACC2IT89_9PLEO|nr:hypothetical protein OPT61_g651 [Boeremia exigua]